MPFECITLNIHSWCHPNSSQSHWSNGREVVFIEKSLRLSKSWIFLIICGSIVSKTTNCNFRMVFHFISFTVENGWKWLWINIFHQALVHTRDVILTCGFPTWKKPTQNFIERITALKVASHVLQWLISLVVLLFTTS